MDSSKQSPAVPGMRLLVAISCLFCSFMAAGPGLADARTYRLSHQWSAGSDARDRAAHVFAEELRKRLPDVSVEIKGDLGYGSDPVGQLDAMIAGRFEMSVYPLFYASRMAPEFSVALLPGLPDNIKLARLLRGTDFERLLQQTAESHSFHILAWFWVGGGIVSRAKPITDPASVRGLVGRGGDAIFDAMLGAAGAKTLALPSNDIAAALKDGKLDFAITSLDSLVSLGIYKYATQSTVGGFGLWTSLQPLIISRASWDALSDAEQIAFEAAAQMAEASFNADQDEAERLTLVTFDKAKIANQKLTFEQYSAWLELARGSAWVKFAGTNAQARDLLTTMLQSFIKTGRQ